MAWKVTCVMEQRMEFVTQALDPASSMTEVCKAFGISRRTGYKWRKRFRERGREGLRDLSRRPKNFPQSTSAELVCEVVRLRLDHPTWGPKKLRAVLQRAFPESRAPACSTMAKILQRVGLVEPRSKPRGKKHTAGRDFVTPEGPNDLWTVDYKGWWKTLDGRRCEPLTIRDEWSRFILDIRATTMATTQTARNIFDEVFRRYGLPKAIRSDNGAPFACTRSPARLSRLSAWWKALGIELERIDPGRPQQNGSHERMHKDIRAELETLLRSTDLSAQQPAFDRWRREFNTERPHEALDMRTPAEGYRLSTRPYTGKTPEPLYPNHFLQRRVRPKGDITLKTKRYFLSESLAGWDVGIEECSTNTLRFWFADLCLGTTDSTLTKPLQPPPQ